MARRPRSGIRWLGAVAGLSLLVTAAAGTALAHGGGIGTGGGSSVRLPTWLVLLTGGAAVGASFLLSSFVTDRALIHALDGWRRPLPDPGRAGRAVGGVLGVGALVAVVVGGLLGPPTGTNPAVLVVWVGWWAGFTTSTYLVGNAWPAVNPWRTVAAGLPTLDCEYPAGIGRWPAVVGLLALVWVEVVGPLAASPRLLALAVVGYSAVTLAGAVAFGPTTWFRRADPVAGVFRLYGRVAPIGRDESGSLALRLPGAGLSRPAGLDGPGAEAFVVALLWATTYDGLVATPAWADAAGAVVALGVPASVLYVLALVAGFALFLGLLRAAATASRQYAATYLSVGSLLALVAPSLVAIAAGAHLAHYLGDSVAYAPALAVPLAGSGTPAPVSLPAWFEYVGMGAVLAGHLLAIWVAHSRAFAAVPDRMAAIRSQAPFVAVMVFYTLASLWIVAQPEVAVPYL
jgi:fumarate reductase subunit D